jgi:hypothetical protein
MPSALLVQAKGFGRSSWTFTHCLRRLWSYISISLAVNSASLVFSNVAFRRRDARWWISRASCARSGGL